MKNTCIDSRLWAPLIGSCLLVVNASATEPPITALAFTPDGESVVATSQSGLLVLDWPELQLDRTLEPSGSNLHSVAFSMNGQRLAVGGGDPAEQGLVEILSWPNGEQVATFDDHLDSVRSVVWLDDTRLFSASIDREIKLWSIGETTESIPSYRGHSRSVDTLCLLRDGKTLISAGVDQSLRVWNFETGQLIRNLSQHTRQIHDLALRPSESGLPMVASAAGDRTIRFWQPTIGRMVRYIRLESEPLAIGWLDASRVVAACIDGAVRVVDADNVKVLQTIPALDGWAYAIAVHPTDSSLVVGGTNGQVQRVVPKRVDR